MTLIDVFVVVSLVALLIAVNARCVAAEFAAVAAQRGQLAERARLGSRRAARLLCVLSDGSALDRYIAACQIGITLSSLIAGAYCQGTLGRVLVPWFEGSFGLQRSAAETATFALILVALTVVQVVLGELVPKSVALQIPERAALATYLPMRVLEWSFGAFIWLLNGSGFLLLKPFGVQRGGQLHVHSPDELAILFSESRKGGKLSHESHARLARGLRLSTRTVRQMMTPRSQIYAVEIAASATELLQKVAGSPYSLIPVYRGALDRIVGVVSSKVVVERFAATGTVPSIETLLQPIPFVPDALRSHRLVRFLQRERSTKAIAVDEHGGVQGIISIKDVLWELFGELGDELAEPAAAIEVLPDGRVRLPGSLRWDDAEAWLPKRWGGAATTVGGHIVAVLGRLPVEGEELQLDGFSVTVTEMSPTAVRWMVVKPAAALPGDAPPETE
ncbi:MAG TPA: hemolysin family protein [Polyangiales bacterium]|nr:hemolysin family protein [Polyangiales bacterium]